MKIRRPRLFWCAFSAIWNVSFVLIFAARGDTKALVAMLPFTVLSIVLLRASLRTLR